MDDRSGRTRRNPPAGVVAHHRAQLRLLVGHRRDLSAGRSRRAPAEKPVATASVRANKRNRLPSRLKPGSGEALHAGTQTRPMPEFCNRLSTGGCWRRRGSSGTRRSGARPAAWSSGGKRNRSLCPGTHHLQDHGRGPGRPESQHPVLPEWSPRPHAGLPRARHHEYTDAGEEAHCTAPSSATPGGDAPGAGTAGWTSTTTTLGGPCRPGRCPSGPSGIASGGSDPSPAGGRTGYSPMGSARGKMRQGKGS